MQRCILTKNDEALFKLTFLNVIRLQENYMISYTLTAFKMYAMEIKYAMVYNTLP